MKTSSKLPLLILVVTAFLSTTYLLKAQGPSDLSDKAHESLLTIGANNCVSKEGISLLPVYEEMKGHRGHQGVAYWIADHDVTVAEYTEFLNAVASDDTYHLYNEAMEHPKVWQENYDYSITRLGSPGNYTYKSTYNNELTPITYIGFYDVIRFCNWLHHGKPQGKQDATTTEQGAYTLNGATRSKEGDTMISTQGAAWFIPSCVQWRDIMTKIPSTCTTDPKNWMFRWTSDISLLHYNTGLEAGTSYGVFAFTSLSEQRSARTTFRVAVPAEKID